MQAQDGEVEAGEVTGADEQEHAPREAPPSILLPEAGELCQSCHRLPSICLCRWKVNAVQLLQEPVEARTGVHLRGGLAHQLAQRLRG